MLNGLGLATSGPAKAGFAIAVEAGGASAGGGAGTGCCAPANAINPNSQSATTAIPAAASRNLADKAQFILVSPDRSGGSRHRSKAQGPRPTAATFVVLSCCDRTAF